MATILIVDDKDENLSLLEALLTATGTRSSPPETAPRRSSSPGFRSRISLSPTS